MGDTVAVVAVVVVLAGVAGAVPAASSAGPVVEDTALQETPANGPQNDTLAPGERMAGVVGAEKAAVESEVAVRAFGQRIAAANSASAKARVVGGQVEDLQARLDELDDERAELEQAHENGSISRGQYRARLAKLYAEERALQRLANRTEQAARDLPDQALAEQGVNVTAIRTLKEDARNLTGPEVAEIARGVAGKGVGRPGGAVPPGLATDATNGSDGQSGNGPPGEDGPPGQSDEDGPGQSGADRGARGQGDGGPADNRTGTADRPGGGPSGNENGGAGDGGAGKPTDTGPGNDRGDGVGNSAGTGSENTTRSKGSGNGGATGNGAGGNGGEGGSDAGSGSGSERGGGSDGGEDTGNSAGGRDGAGS